MDDQQRKRATRRAALDHFEQERNSFAPLEMTESDEDETTTSTSDDNVIEEEEEEDEDEDEYMSAGDLFNSGIQPELGFLFEEEEEMYNYGDQEIEEDDVDPDELSYEELIALGESVGVESRGLSEAEISGHLHPFGWKSLQNSHTNIDRCVICQVEFEGGEKLVALPCDHPYHSDCITPWLQINKAATYSDARPTYPKEWYSMLAERTSNRSLAWDVGTGNGQAAIGVAEHYEQVIGTDVSEGQLKYAMPHPKVSYVHTPLSMSDDELVTLIGGEGTVDLITVAQAVHWFDLPRFYSIVTRLLRKPGGVIALWGYKGVKVSLTFDEAKRHWYRTTLPYWNSKADHVYDEYKTLPFPFESVGLGSEGNPLFLDIPKEVSFEGHLGFLRSWSAVATAKEQGVDLLPAEVVKELETAWGGANLVRTIVFNAFMLSGKVKL